MNYMHLSICKVKKRTNNKFQFSFSYIFPLYTTLRNDNKQSHSEASAMLELWGTQRTHSLPGVAAPEIVLSMEQRELFDIKTEQKQMTYAKMNSWNITVWLFICM